MAKSKYQDEFESLGIEETRKRAASSIWGEDKLREAREWISREDNRTARSAKNAAWAAAIAAMISAAAAIVAIVVSFYFR
jgi:hypothetical protein